MIGSRLALSRCSFQIPKVPAPRWTSCSILVQMLVGAAGLFYVVDEGSLGATVPAEGIGVGQAFLVEVVLTLLRVNSIYRSAVSGKAESLSPRLRSA